MGSTVRALATVSEMQPLAGGSAGRTVGDGDDGGVAAAAGAAVAVLATVLDAAAAVATGPPIWPFRRWRARSGSRSTETERLRSFDTSTATPT